MTRRTRLPGADDLFRSTETKDVDTTPGRRVAAGRAGGDDDRSVPPKSRPGKAKPRHQEKVTYYCTAEALTRLEGARLTLRADHNIASDRGRIVRAALDEVLDDLDARGDESALVRRLQATD